MYLMYTLSIILNLHREGNLVRNTISNIRDVLDDTKRGKNWDDIEIVAVLDNADDTTKKVVLDNQDIFQKISEVDFRDLALSRNHGVALSKNNFILFADGDDYISNETLSSIFELFFSHYSKCSYQLTQLSYQQHVAVFPSLLVEFPKLHFQKYKNANEFIIDNMKFHHCFVSRISCPKVLLVNNLLKKNEHPYGYEDWDLNNRLLALGVKFVIAHGYVLYYRRSRATSLMGNQTKNKCIVRNSLLYDKNFLKSVQTKKNIRSSRIKLRCNKLKKNIFDVVFKTQFVGNIKKIHGKFLEIKHRKFLLQYQETELSVVGGATFDSSTYFADHFSVESSDYEKIVYFLEEKEVVIVSDLSNDSPFFNKFGNHISVIKTSENDSNCDAIITDCNNISFCRMKNELSEDMKTHVLLKALINSVNVKKIYCVQSEIGDLLTQRYGSVLEEYGKSVVSACNLELEIFNPT